MVVAADTNVLVRLLVADDLAQQQAVLARFRAALEDGGRVLVVSVTLAELTWVLRAVYGYDRARIASAVEAILRTPPLEVVDADAAVAALARYRRGPADFSDYLTLELSHAAGAETLLTFDRKLAKLADCEEP